MWSQSSVGKPQFSSVQSLSVQLFVTPWTAARQASLSLTNSWRLFKLMSIESVRTSNHLIFCHPLLLLQSFQASGSFPMSQLFASGGQSIGVPASASVLPMNIQDWFPLGLTGLISLQSTQWEAYPLSKYSNSPLFVTRNVFNFLFEKVFQTFGSRKYSEGWRHTLSFSGIHFELGHYLWSITLFSSRIQNTNG